MLRAIELAPEGTGYRAKTRFARFHNLPELMSMFRMVADIQTADMLQLPVPEHPPQRSPARRGRRQQHRSRRKGRRRQQGRRSRFTGTGANAEQLRIAAI